MIRLLSVLVVLAINPPALSAADLPVDCLALYQQLKRQAPGDVSVCEQPVAPARLEHCQAPINVAAGARPASHVVLVLDASGSMAARLGGQTKMVAARQEALAFLTDLADEVPVGLIVYGHRGDNTSAGKASSCASIEWVHRVGSDKAGLARSIAGIKPTGWTPLGGALAFANVELAKLPRTHDDTVFAPVVYLISDGEETCGGDPLAAARALHDAGRHARVSVLGFDADAKTREQLAAIARAGGGRYFPADDIKALRAQLRAILDAEQSLARYNYCIEQNVGRAGVVYHNATVAAAGCFQRETKTKRLDRIQRQAQQMATDDDDRKACVEVIRQAAYADYVAQLPWLAQKNRALQAAREAAMAAARNDAGRAAPKPR